jgi:hypothetical protein
MQALGGWATSAMSPIALTMKTFSKYLSMLAVMLTASPAVFAESHASSNILAQQIASLTKSGPNDPAPAIPASDIVQRDAPAR